MPQFQTINFEVAESPTWHIEPVAPETVPEVAVNEFLRKNGQHNAHPLANIAGFAQLLRIDGGDELITHAAVETREYPTNGDVERLIYLADQTMDGQKVGYGEVRLNLSDQSDYYKDKPLVGYTRTMQEFQRRGYGRRRLLVMNALSRQILGLELHSDTLNFARCPKTMGKTGQGRPGYML